jgi:hypothetical protein
MVTTGLVVVTVVVEAGVFVLVLDPEVISSATFLLLQPATKAVDNAAIKKTDNNFRFFIFHFLPLKIYLIIITQNLICINSRIKGTLEMIFLLFGRRNYMQDKECKKENQVDSLINLVEKKTRTERHLEEHSDVGDPERLERPKELQKQRDAQIQNLKSAIASSSQGSDTEYENLKDNIQYADGYIKENGAHMDKGAFENLEKKQEHRKDQLDTFE